MKRIALSVMSLAVAAAGIAAAQDYHNDPRNGSSSRSDWAQVVSVDRVGGGQSSSGYEREECWNESTRGYEGGYYRDREGRLYRGDSNDSKTRNTILGAIVGGALGNQVGKGDGRTAATVAGAAIGASVGAHSGNNNQPEYQFRDNRGVVRRCRTVFVPTGPSGPGAGWSVTYRYGGQQYRDYTNARPDVRPGSRIKVVVDVRLQDR